jgi:hypothetical protein
MHLLQLVLVLGLACGLLVHEMKDINKKKRKRMDSIQQTQKSSTSSSSSFSFLGRTAAVPPLYSYDDEKLNSIARAYPKWGESAAVDAATEMADQPLFAKNSGESYRWCPLVLPQSTEKSKQVGLHFVKTFPTTSANTCTGITLTIAHRVGRKKGKQYDQQQGNHTTQTNSTATTAAAAAATAPNNIAAAPTNTADTDAICSTHFYSHGLQKYVHPSYRNKSSSFLWTIVQEPTAFAWNTFYDWRDIVDSQQYNNNNNEHNDKNGTVDPTLLLDHLQQSINIQYNQIQNVIRRGNNNNHPDPLRRRHHHQQQQQQQPQQRIMRVDRTTTLSNAHTSENNLDDIYQAVQETIQQYDFIAVADRLPESLVVLKFVLDLDHGDILALSWKSSGPYARRRTQQQPQQQQQQQQGGSSNTVCVRIPDTLPPPLTSSFQLASYLETTFLNPLLNVDNLLYVTASKSLDATIDSIPGGRLGFERVLQEHLIWQTLVDEYCAPPRTKFPCSTTGVYQGEAAAVPNCFVVPDTENDDDQDDHDDYYGCGHACIAQLWQESGGNHTRAIDLLDAWRRRENQ